MRPANRTKTDPLPRRREAIVEAYGDAGASVRGVAKRFDLSVRQVRAVLAAAGVDLRPVGRPAGAELPDVAARLVTLPAPSPVPDPPPFPIPSPALPIAENCPTAPAAAAPEPAAARPVSALEKRIYDHGKDLEDKRPILWRCQCCHRPIHEPGQTRCRCGWVFLTGRAAPPRRPMVPSGFNPNRAIFVDSVWGPGQW